MSDNDLLPLLTERLLGTYSPLLADVAAAMLFTAGGMANWTVVIDGAGHQHGGAGRPIRP
ncbi:MAG: hypothetical protein ABI368_08865 [Jatrophihabitantaceae bacterium]